MGGCPSNSTDCLLQQLIASKSSFDWSPLNFAFTAILSSVGLVIALTALLQALLAAGPGRLKASKAAIGSCANRTAKTRFDRTELRFRTIVSTPEIDIDQLLSGLPFSKSDSLPFFYGPLADQKSLSLSASESEGELKTDQDLEEFQNGNDGEAPGSYAPDRETFQSRLRQYVIALRNSSLLHSTIACRIRGSNHLKNSTSEDDRAAIATWARLFYEIGVKPSDFRLSECRTDSLPEDVHAAPAAATIECVIIMSILAGCTAYHVDDHTLPLAMGRQVQVDFKEHPTLGLVASYQRYHGSHHVKRRTSFEIHQICNLALGNLTFHREPFLRCNERSSQHIRLTRYARKLGEIIDKHHQDCVHAKCELRQRMVPSWFQLLEHQQSLDQAIILSLLFGDKPGSLRLYPADQVAARGSLVYLAQACKKWPARLSLMTILECLREVTSDKGQLLVFSERFSEPKIYVDRKYSCLQSHHLKPRNDSHSLGDIIPNTYQEQVSDNSSWLHDPEMQPLRPVRDRFPLCPEQTFVKENNIEKKAVGSYVLVSADEELLISGEVLNYCLDWYNKTISDMMTESNENRMRNWIAWQLSEIDWWLAHQGGQDALCAALSLMKEFHNVHLVARRDSVTVEEPVGNRDLPLGRPTKKLSFCLNPFLLSSLSEADTEFEGRCKSNGEVSVVETGKHYEVWAGDQYYRPFDDHPQDRTTVHSPTDSTESVPQFDTKRSPSPARFFDTNTDTATPTPDPHARSTCESDESKPKLVPERVNLADKRIEALEVLLVYRAILFGTLLSTAIDSSALLAMRAHGRYVYIL